MKNLVLKDLYSQRAAFYLTGLIWFIPFTSFFTDGTPIRHIMLMSFLAYWLTMFSNYKASNKEGNQSIFDNILPVTRQQIVLSKYLAGFMWYSIAAIAVVIYVILFKNFAPFPTRLVSIEDLIFGLCGFYIMLATFYPLLNSFGFQVSSLVGSLVPFVLFMGFQIMINIINNPRLTFTDDLIDKFEDNKLLIVALLVLFTLVLTIVSYFISNRIYKKKDF